MKLWIQSVLFIYILSGVMSCRPDQPKVSPSSSEPSPNRLEKAALNLKNYDSLTRTKVMVVGTLHFPKDILESDNQENISKLITVLSTFNPTKIVVEWEPSEQVQTNTEYQSFLAATFDISDKENEVYQLGFRLARHMKHDSIYLFDDQTEFNGSLREFYTEKEGFSFDAFSSYAKNNDSGFYDKYEKTLIETFDQNQKTFKSYNLYDRIALMNSPAAQKINAHRMHMYEIRVGIQKNWVGPDWLGRWYQRNVRMTSNVLKMNNTGDRILIIVGDNHKWTLDRLFENTPDFEVVSSWDLLKNGA